MMFIGLQAWNLRAAWIWGWWYYLPGDWWQPIRLPSSHPAKRQTLKNLI